MTPQLLHAVGQRCCCHFYRSCLNQGTDGCYAAAWWVLAERYWPNHGYSVTLKIGGAFAVAAMRGELLEACFAGCHPDAQHGQAMLVDVEGLERAARRFGGLSHWAGLLGQAGWKTDPHLSAAASAALCWAASMDSGM